MTHDITIRLGNETDMFLHPSQVVPAARRGALEDVPPEWRELVRRHVEVVFLLRGSAHKRGN